MKAWIVICCIILILAIPAHGTQITAPDAPEDVQELLPYENTTFSEGLWHVVSRALEAAFPAVSACFGVCLSAVAVVLLLSVLRTVDEGTAPIAGLCGTVLIACILLEPANSMIQSAVTTVEDLSNYGKLLLPVMTAALAAQGGGTAAAALYSGTAVFDAALAAVITKLLAPAVYLFLALAVMAAATGNDSLTRLKKTAVNIVSKGLRIVLYIFTGYLTVTGVIGGTADQMSLKAAKLTISGMVPVVGNIMAEASETILVSAGIMKSAAGVYGLLSVIAIGIGPFLNVGIRYLLLKATAAACSMFGEKEATELIGDFGSAMGLLLAMTGTQCLLLLISTVCFMKGMG